MKQHTKNQHAGRRLLAAVIAALLALSLSGCSFFGPKEKQTEWIVDGKYKPLYPAENTTKKLIGCLETGDVEQIYTAFSPAAKEQQEDLREKIKELSDFVQNEVVSWEHDIGGNLPSTSVHDGNVKRSRDWFIKFQTRDGEYGGLAIDVVNDDYDSQNIGFYTLAVYPEDLSLLCGNGYYDTLDSDYDEDRAGIFFFQREKEYDTLFMERLLELVKEKDSGGICDLFSQYAKENTDNLSEMAETFLNFMDRPFLSSEFYGCVSEQVLLPDTEEKIMKRHAMYVLETSDRNYVLHLRDLLQPGEDKKSLGLYSIAINAEEHAVDYKNLGWHESGIFVKQLTLDTSLEGIQDSIATVVLSTSIEAEVTSDSKDVVPKQLDALTWKVTIPIEGWEPYTFTATAGEESVEQHISVDIDDGEERVIIFDKYELD